MRVFAIHDESIDSIEPIGYLQYFERNKEYVIELRENLDEWDAPLLFQKKVHEGEYTILNELAYLWVKERVIPSGRQNIREILANSKISEYDEIALLSITKGICSQDECYLKEISYEDIPEDIKSRKDKNISDCFMSEGNCIVCLFNDNIAVKVSLNKLSEDYKLISHVIRNKILQKNLKVDSGGYSISFDCNIVISANILRNNHYSEPLSASDFFSYVKNGLVSSSGVCDILGCSRQNVSYLVKEAYLPWRLEMLQETEF